MKDTLLENLPILITSLLIAGIRLITLGSLSTQGQPQYVLTDTAILSLLSGYYIFVSRRAKNPDSSLFDLEEKTKRTLSLYAKLSALIALFMWAMSLKAYWHLVRP